MKYILVYLLLCAPLQLFSQTNGIEHNKWCMTAHKMNERRANPTLSPQFIQDSIIKAQEAISGIVAPKGTIYRIPIVFHILHYNSDGLPGSAGAGSNTTEEQIFNALEVLNRDFRLQNADTADVLPIFKPIMGDVEIEFVLATKAPDGSCFRGYTRTESPLTLQGDDGAAQVNAIRNGNDVYQGNWPSKKYLNVFVVADAGGAGGYTWYPNGSGNDMNSGIWILHQQFGEIGTSSLAGGRSLTHECGHWFNLPHTWGSTNTPGDWNLNCNGMDDGILDTPYTMGVPFGCPLSQPNCDSTGIANVQNYMDYALACQSMFTLGQVDEMRIAVQSSVGGRSNLWSQANLISTGTDVPPSICATEFEADRTSVCQGTAVSFDDLSYNGANGWWWNFEGGTPAISTNENPVVVYNTPGLYEVSLMVTDGTLTGNEIKSAYIRVLPEATNIPILEGFESYSTLSNIEEWGIYNEGNNASFELVNGTAYTGIQSVKLGNHGQQTGFIDELISAPVDLSTLDTLTDNLTISFRYAYARRNSNDNDFLRLLISSDCGENWFIKKTLPLSVTSNTIQSTSYTPATQDEWKTVHVTTLTTAYEHWTENFRYKFEFVSGGGNNIYIDDINIYGGLPSDLFVIGLEENTSMSKLLIYPNPVENILNIDFELVEPGITQIEIQDISGKKVISKSFNSNFGENNISIETGALSSGIYLVNVANGTSRKTMRFVQK